jgi:hypothetical protein
MTNWKAFMAVAIGLAALPGYAQNLGVGIKVGAYLPSSGKTRDAFGDTWVSYGIRPVSVRTRSGLVVDTDVDVIGRNRSGNRVLIIAPTFGVTQYFGEEGQSSLPYAALRVGPAYFDYAITQPGGRISERRVGWNGNVEAGLILSRSIQLHARYDLMSRMDGFTFDGFSVGLTWQVARF